MSKKTSSKWVKFFTNKYVIVILVLLILIFGVTNYNVFDIVKLNREVKQLHKDEQALKESITTDSIHAHALEDDLEAIERYGREIYFMKRADEDVFVISPEDE